MSRPGHDVSAGQEEPRSCGPAWSGPSGSWPRPGQRRRSGEAPRALGDAFRERGPRAAVEAVITRGAAGRTDLDRKGVRLVGPAGAHRDQAAHPARARPEPRLRSSVCQLGGHVTALDISRRRRPKQTHVKIVRNRLGHSPVDPDTGQHVPSSAALDSGQASPSSEAAPLDRRDSSLRRH